LPNVYIPSASQKRLLALARETLESFVRGIERPAEEIGDRYLLSADYGAFVSLHRRKELRGCIGTCFPTAPLYETVVEMTEAAASRDRRVDPILPAELADIRIDISVLSPLEPVENPLALEAGKYGLHVTRGKQRGVLLPQVAVQYGWDMETFLAQLCVKAGLSKNDWKRPETKLSAFTALIIEERG
jgi:AmmeMemoRadiSam system protein A